MENHLRDHDLLLASARDAFEQYKDFAERAIEQIPDTALHEPLDANTNSIAVIVQHLAGNLQSRWTDVLTTDGEKPWRDRDQEFIDQNLSRNQLLAQWNDGWTTLFNALAMLKNDDLTRHITIRGHSLALGQAITRSVTHCAYHVGQIVLIARVHAGANWQTLSIPRGQSQQYNKQVWHNPRQT